MVDLPMPSVVSFIQMVFTVVVIYMLSCCGVKVDDFEWDKLKPYMLYIVAFVFAIYTNMQALNYSNIETVIVFRSCTPISVTLVEYLFMGRDLPSLRSAVVSTVMGKIEYYYSVTRRSVYLLLDCLRFYTRLYIVFFCLSACLPALSACPVCLPCLPACQWQWEM